MEPSATQGKRSSRSRHHRPLEQLRDQARLAIERFIQTLIDDPENAASLGERRDSGRLAETLWREGLVVVCRLLFILKLEQSPTPPRFVATERWRSTMSPTAALDPRRDRQPGFAESLRAAFRAFCEGDSELSLAPLGGSLFSSRATPMLDTLRWSDEAVSALIGQLLQAPDRSRLNDAVAFDSLTTEDLGTVYEGLIDLEPGYATEAMCRLRHPRLEVVVPERAITTRRGAPIPEVTRGKVVETERLQRGRFYLRTGLGRKTTGSYYTPRALVAFLVRETLDPLIGAVSPEADPRPLAILDLKILDPAMGSGHFLIEACRRLGAELAEACRRCRELAHGAEELGDRERAAALRSRVADLPLDVTADEASTELFEVACRRAVASRCLYGVDKNLFAAELAKLSLWLETHVDGMPLPLLDRALVCGDALTGASLGDLLVLPGSLAPLPDALSRDLEVRCAEAVTSANSSGGDRGPLVPLRTLAAAWSGGVMLDEAPDATDASYRRLVEACLAGEDRLVDSADSLGRRMIDVGSEGVSFELTFPEVCRGDSERGPLIFGFDAVVGNPPWDKVHPLEREFYASYDPAVLTAPTARERRPLYEALRREPAVRAAWEAYAAPFGWTRRFIEAAYRWQVTSVDTAERHRATTGHADQYRFFVERSWRCLSPTGRFGLVLPNTFYNASGATGVRRLLLERASLELCLGFSNARGIFEIGRGQRFCLVVASREARSVRVRVRFGLDDATVLSRDDWDRDLVDLDLSLLSRTSPGYLCFPEVTSRSELALIEALYERGTELLSEELRRRHIVLYQEMNMTTDSGRFSTTPGVLSSLGINSQADPRREPTRTALFEKGWLCVHEKGTFRAFDDGVKAQPRYLCHASRLLAGARHKTKALEASRYYRLVVRATIHATEREKSVFCLIPPAVVVGNSALAEAAPAGRPNAAALVLMAICNSRAFNFVTRLRLGTNLNQFLFESLPLPLLDPLAERFCAHAALRLTCNHEAYAQLVAEQVGASRHASPRYPVLADADERQAVRGELDALIAHAYGVTRAQYERLLASASSGGPGEPASARSLDAFDALARDGLEAFVERRDPYSQQALVMTLPRPLSNPAAYADTVGQDRAGIMRNVEQLDLWSPDEEDVNHER